MLLIDRPIFEFLYQLVDTPFKEGLVVFAAGYLGWLLLIGFLMFEIVEITRGFGSHWERLLFVLACALSSWFLAEVLQFLITSPRPFVLIDGVRQLVSSGGNSFPSGHAAGFFALGLSVMKYYRRLGFWYLSAAAVIGLARVFAGVHWPSDVLAGFILAALVVNLISFFIKSRYNYRHV